MQAFARSMGASDEDHHGRGKRTRSASARIGEGTAVLRREARRPVHGDAHGGRVADGAGERSHAGSDGRPAAPVETPGPRWGLTLTSQEMRMDRKETARTNRTGYAAEREIGDGTARTLPGPTGHEDNKGADPG